MKRPSASHDTTQPRNPARGLALNSPKKTIDSFLVNNLCPVERPTRLRTRRHARRFVTVARCWLRLEVIALLLSKGLSSDTDRSRSNLRIPEWCDLSCRCASDRIARVSWRLWAMVPSDGAPSRTKPLRGGMSGVIVRLKAGVEGLSRCLIASTEHMFSMGATDILTDVAAL